MLSDPERCVQVGAQNAGKSSLINAMRRAVGHGKPREELTTAPLPGTTLGVFISGPMQPSCPEGPACWSDLDLT